MNAKTFFCLLILVFQNLNLFAQQTTPSFSQFLLQIEELPTDEKNQEIEAFIQNAGQTPIIEGNKVIFLAKGNLKHTPTLLADFNGFMNTRYVKDESLGKMQQLGATHWYYFEKELDPKAIINYRYKLGETILTDPLNPAMRFGFGSLFSVVQMPAFEIPTETILDYAIPRGTVLSDSISSTIFGKTRQLNVYLPFGYENMENLSTLYLHDGFYYIENALVPQILDKLIAQKKIQPIIAVFDNPFIRGKEYRGDIEYRNYIERELISHIEKNYKVAKSKSDRAVIGGSRGGLSSLYLAHSLNVFSKCGVFSPAIHPKTVEEFTEELESFEYQPEQVFITGATYDHIWFQDAVDLKDYFSQQKDLESHYLEQSTGHNIPAWRSFFDEVFISFFPNKNN